jgi:hypothetical protein
LARLAGDCTADSVLDTLEAEDSSVRAAIGSSYRALPPAARTAFSRAAVYLADEIPARTLTDFADGDHRVAAKLVSVGLVTAAEVETSGHGFHMHPLVRVYGRELARGLIPAPVEPSDRLV